MAVRGDLLMIVHRVPYPPDKGDKIRSFNQLKFLAGQGWRIHLCALADDPADLKHAGELGKFCASVAIERINPKCNKLISALAPLHGFPMSSRYFYNSKLQSRINDILSRHPVSAVFCFCAPMAEYLRKSPHNPLMREKDIRITCVMDLVDVDSDKWEQYARHHHAPLKWAYQIEGQLLHRYEQRILQSFDAVALVSEAEAEVFRKRTGFYNKIYAVGNGVDLDYFHPVSVKTSADCYAITFCGAMNYLPNVDAVCWFANEVLPHIRKVIENVEFWIVGGGATHDVKALEKYPWVKVTGRVPDVRPYVWKSHLSVTPVRIARGIQNKVLEAMAMAVPTLVTPQAFEGLEVEAGKDVFVAPAEAEVFAAKALEALGDPELRQTVAFNARRMMEEKYSWNSRLLLLDNLLLSPVSANVTPEAG